MRTRKIWKRLAIAFALVTMLASRRDLGSSARARL